MAISLAVILLLGLLANRLFEKLKMPGLLGMLILGVIISLFTTNLNWKERLFCVIAYVPKATVQAAMGAIPLSLGVESGMLFWLLRYYLY